jgi:hypothetical protein
MLRLLDRATKLTPGKAWKPEWSTCDWIAGMRFSFILTPFHAAVLEPQGTGGTNVFPRRLLVARFIGLIFSQAME